MTHADVATQLVMKLDSRIWAKACADAVLYNDFHLLKRLLPGVDFTVELVGVNQRTVVGTCTDGSLAVWKVGMH